MNNCTFIGRLTKAPEIRSYYTKENGKKVDKEMACFSLAIQRRGDVADFINVKAFGRLAELAEDYLEKGKQIGLRAHVSTGKYETEDGGTRYFTDFIADEIFFTGRKDVETNSGEKPRKPVKKVSNPAKPAKKKRREEEEEFEDFEDLEEVFEYD